MIAALVALAVMLGAQGGPPGPGSEAAPPVEAQAATPAETAARKVLDGRYQRALPLVPLEGGSGDTVDDGHGGRRPRIFPGRPKSAPERQREREREREEREVPTPLAVATRFIIYGVLAVALVMVIMWLARDLKRGGDAEALEGDLVPEPTVDQDVIERPVGDADELARAGRYTEAIHTLLLRTLIELVRATRTRVPASLTSREIMARVPLVPAARTALYALVSAVELSYFGDEVPGAADYERCRGEFQRFAEAYRGAA
jgi:hypothetical protein